MSKPPFKNWLRASAAGWLQQSELKGARVLGGVRGWGEWSSSDHAMKLKCSDLCPNPYSHQSPPAATPPWSKAIVVLPQPKRKKSRISLCCCSCPSVGTNAVSFFSPPVCSERTSCCGIFFYHQWLEGLVFWLGFASCDIKPWWCAAGRCLCLCVGGALYTDTHTNTAYCVRCFSPLSCLPGKPNDGGDCTPSPAGLSPWHDAVYAVRTRRSLICFNFLWPFIWSLAWFN